VVIISQFSPWKKLFWDYGFHYFIEELIASYQTCSLRWYVKYWKPSTTSNVLCHKNVVTFVGWTHILWHHNFTHFFYFSLSLLPWTKDFSNDNKFFCVEVPSYFSWSTSSFKYYSLQKQNFIADRLYEAWRINSLNTKFSDEEVLRKSFCID